ncbi:uncharacterized protein G2W53_042290 [Senna tora]|uniref:Uncharacterized protein n=1 Tax=Senna tora TaxID=362788 RepID=A0A834W3N4_9FABA|nr:uncharacterized protein G2W53_042290 [Senna tora]
MEAPPLVEHKVNLQVDRYKDTRMDQANVGCHIPHNVDCRLAKKERFIYR